jgi:3alpha(or 20beta)-hydroxysteroid dehydrogenase
MAEGNDASRGRLDGKVAIISGAARGLGACMARLFAAEGAAVLVTDVRDELGEGVAADIRETGGQALYVHLDVRSEAEWADAVQRCERELGPPTTFVVNAFRYTHPTILELSTQEWQENLDINLTGGFFGLRAVLPGMIERGHGTIVTIGSSNGNEMSLPSQAGYQAAKAGLTALTRHVAVTYGPDGIRANAIHPGPFRGPMLDEVGFAEGASRIASVFPIARLGEPEEIAAAALHLASDESSYTTGTVLVIDGGSVATINLPRTPATAGAAA